MKRYITTFAEELSKTATAGTVREIRTLEDASHYATRCTWSPALFHGAIRGNEVIGADFLVLDIDSGMTYEHAGKQVRMLGFAAVLLGTRNHQKEKDGVVEDRFRVICPLSRRVTAAEYIALHRQAVSTFPVDKQTHDAGRIYFPSPHPVTIVAGAAWNADAAKDEAEAENGTAPNLQELHELREAYDPKALEQRARDYLAKMPASVSGQGGHGALFAAAVKLRQGFLLDEKTGMRLLEEYNERSVPPWTTADLERKWEEAAKVTTPQLHEGHMLVRNLGQYRVAKAAAGATTQATTDASAFQFRPPPKRTKGNDLEFEMLVSSLRGKVWRDQLSGYDQTDMDLPGCSGLREWTDADTLALRAYLSQQGIEATTQFCHDAASQAAQRETRNRLTEYFARVEELQPNPDLAEERLIRQGASDTKATRIMSRIWGLGAVRRALIPGSRADYTLMLIGPQGYYKSSLCASLVPDRDMFCELAGDIESKDEQMKLRRAWVAELGEMASLRKSEQEAVKQFLTRTVDEYRQPYERRTSLHPRRCVFIATTNDAMSLVDQSGSRRFFPINIDSYLRPLEEADRDAMWCALLDLAKKGSQHWPTREEETILDLVRKDHEPGDALDDQIQKILGDSTRIRMVQLLEALGYATHQFNARLNGRIGNKLRRAGWLPRTRTDDDGKLTRYWEKIV